MFGARIKPSSVAMAFAAACLVAVSLTATALVFPEMSLAAGSNLAPVFERRADALATTAAANEVSRLASISDTRKSIAQSPANPTAWLRLAYLDSLAPAGLGRAGDHALAASYSVAPYGPDVTDWRLIFAFDHWDLISDENRRAVIDELRVTSTPRSPRRLLSRVTNPAGRVALILMLGIMEREAEASQPAV